MWVREAGRRVRRGRTREMELDCWGAKASQSLWSGVRARPVSLVCCISSLFSSKEVDLESLGPCLID